MRRIFAFSLAMAVLLGGCTENTAETSETLQSSFSALQSEESTQQSEESAASSLPEKPREFAEVLLQNGKVAQLDVTDLVGYYYIIQAVQDPISKNHAVLYARSSSRKWETGDLTINLTTFLEVQLFDENGGYLDKIEGFRPHVYWVHGQDAFLQPISVYDGQVTFYAKSAGSNFYGLARIDTQSNKKEVMLYDLAYEQDGYLICAYIHNSGDDAESIFHLYRGRTLLKEIRALIKPGFAEYQPGLLEYREYLVRETNPSKETLEDLDEPKRYCQLQFDSENLVLQIYDGVTTATVDFKAGSYQESSVYPPELFVTDFGSSPDGQWRFYFADPETVKRYDWEGNYTYGYGSGDLVRVNEKTGETFFVRQIPSRSKVSPAFGSNLLVGERREYDLIDAESGRVLEENYLFKKIPKKVGGPFMNDQDFTGVLCIGIALDLANELYLLANSELTTVGKEGYLQPEREDMRVVLNVFDKDGEILRRIRTGILITDLYGYSNSNRQIQIVPDGEGNAALYEHNQQQDTTRFLGIVPYME